MAKLLALVLGFWGAIILHARASTIESRVNQWDGPSDEDWHRARVLSGLGWAVLTLSYSVLPPPTGRLGNVSITAMMPAKGRFWRRVL